MPSLADTPDLIIFCGAVITAYFLGITYRLATTYKVSIKEVKRGKNKR